MAENDSGKHESARVVDAVETVDEIETSPSAFVPWPLIGEAFGDARRMWLAAWPAILVYSALQCAGIAAAYALILRVGLSATVGAGAFTGVGAFALVVIGGFLGAPLARHATISGNARPTDFRTMADLLPYYRGATSVFRAIITVFAALAIGVLALSFGLLVIGAILCAVGGIFGKVFVLIASFIVVPLLGVLFFPIAHFLWAAASIAPQDPRNALTSARAVFSSPAVRGDAFVWGAAMMVLTVAALSLLLVTFSATALFGNVVVSAIVGIGLLAAFMSMQWALAMRFHRVIFGAQLR